MTRPYRALGVICLFAIALLLAAEESFAQGSKADYERAFALRGKMSSLFVNKQVDPHWLSQTEFWYSVSTGANKTEFVLIDAAEGTRELAFDHEALAEALSEETDKKVEATALPITKMIPYISRQTRERAGFYLRIRSRWWRMIESPDGIELRQLDEAPEFEEPKRVARIKRETITQPSRKSPDRKWSVKVEEEQLTLVNEETGELHPKFKLPKGTDRARVLWSPNSKHFIYLEQVKGTDRKVTLVESSPRGQVQPKIHEFRYLKPGDEVFWQKPHLFAVGQGEEIKVDESLYENPFTVGSFRWSETGETFTFLFNERGHQTLRLVEFEASAGETRAVIEEKSPTFIDYAYKTFLHRIDSTDEIVWMSERDGRNHLYLYDQAKGVVKNQITRGQYIVRSVDHVDVEKRQIWFQASSVHAGQDPYYIHACRIDFDGSDFQVLTEGDGTHSIKYSPDMRYLIDRYSRVDMAPVTELRDAQSGELVLELERSDLTALKQAGWKSPERFVAKGRDGKTDIYGIINRPTNFDDAKKYPVIEEHYAGPHGAHCPKGFRLFHRSQAEADLGFIVVQLDGMGTNHRGKEFHDVCWKNIVDAGFPDRIAWIKAAAQHEPAMDITRVGIRGTSAGGQTGMVAVWKHSDFYKAAVSNCGCHDNRMDKIWWNEAWMGWPIDDHYKEQSNVTNAHKLGGKLLLIVGELDRNVPPESTYQLVDALIKADKDFEFLMVPGTGHGAGSKYTTRKTWDFFVKELHGLEPRHEK